MCPELFDLYFPSVLISSDYIYTFKEILKDNYNLVKYEDIKLNYNIFLVREFLSKFNKIYLELFDKCLSDGTFDIFYTDCYKDKSIEPICIENHKNVSIDIPINDNLKDGAVIIHEFFHYTNSKQKVGIRQVITELISIYAELRYYQFLTEYGYSNQNFCSGFIERIDNVFDAAYNVNYSGAILDIYFNTGQLNKKNIMFIDKYRNLYMDNFNSILSFCRDYNCIEDVYNYHIDFGYLFGLLISINLLKEPELNDLKIIYINEHMKELNIQQILNILDINLNNYEELINYCKEKFIEAKGELGEKNNSNIRTYWSWKN